MSDSTQYMSFREFSETFFPDNLLVWYCSEETKPNPKNKQEAQRLYAALRLFGNCTKLIPGYMVDSVKFWSPAPVTIKFCKRGYVFSDIKNLYRFRDNSQILVENR